MPKNTTRLARVQTPAPRVLALECHGDGAAAKEQEPCVRVVAQIRPQLLHVVQNGQLMCVVRSRMEICAMAECRSASAGDSPQLLVATMDGSVYLVRLPPTRQSPTKPIMLEETVKSKAGSTATSPCFIRRLGQVPGVQQLRYIASLDAVVCTSLLSPTTAMCGVLNPSRSSHVEIDELEGEQSTCVAVVDAARGERVGVTVLQGDADGFVRAALLKDDGSVAGCSEIVQLGEPVLAVLPLSAVGGLDEDTLVVGVKGSLAMVLSSRTNAKVLRGRFPCALQAAVLLVDDAEPSLLLVTKAKSTLSVSLAVLLAQLEDSTTTSSKTSTVDLTATPAGNASLKDIVSIGSHGSVAGVVSFLNGSGMLFSLPRDVILAVSDVAPSATPTASSEHHVKSLLQEIGSLSESSKNLQRASQQADDVLNALNSALLVRQIVDTRGFQSLASCPLRMKLAASGWAMQTTSVHLHFAFQAASSSAQLLLAGSTWRILITVHAGETDAFSYSFALSSCIGIQRTIELDKSVLHQLDGVIHVSSELVFVPDSAASVTEGAQQPGSRKPRLASFAIPMTRSQCFHLVQLSKPVAAFPTNPSAIRNLFQQDNEALVNDIQSQLLQGHEWWPAIRQLATDTGISLHRQASLQQGMGDNDSQPLRFVLQVPMAPASRSSKSSSEAKPGAIDGDDAMALLAPVFDIQGDEERAAWRAACRVVGGKWWVGMRTHSGNLIVLRLATPTSQHDEDKRDLSRHRIEVTVQTSSVSDLAAMRALIAHVYRDADTTPPAKIWSAQDISSASLALSATRDELASLAATMEDMKRKLVASVNQDVQLMDLCHDEWLQLLQRTAEVETRSIDLYWKSREVVNQKLTL